MFSALKFGLFLCAIALAVPVALIAAHRVTDSVVRHGRQTRSAKAVLRDTRVSTATVTVVGLFVGAGMLVAITSVTQEQVLRAWACCVTALPLSPARPPHPTHAQVTSNNPPSSPQNLWSSAVLTVGQILVLGVFAVIVWTSHSIDKQVVRVWHEARPPALRVSVLMHISATIAPANTARKNRELLAPVLVRHLAVQASHWQGALRAGPSHRRSVGSGAAGGR